MWKKKKKSLYIFLKCILISKYRCKSENIIIKQDNIIIIIIPVFYLSGTETNPCLIWIGSLRTETLNPTPALVTSHRDKVHQSPSGIIDGFQPGCKTTPSSTLLIQNVRISQDRLVPFIFNKNKYDCRY